MPFVKSNATLQEFQKFIQEVYGFSNDRKFSVWDMLANVERFLMRGLKGIRKGDKKKTTKNLLITLSWFISLLNQMHINAEEDLWGRFPGVCSYCGKSLCVCQKNKQQKRKMILPKTNRPKTISDFQVMFESIYPSGRRSLDHSGIHLAEEMGELSEAFMAYRGDHSEKNFAKIRHEAADWLSCFMGVFNSLDLNLADELSRMFSKNCHECKKTPCECSFERVVNYKS
jgi:NTP pyrophosphatase (non-canonical NTP hydrolase)